MTATRTEIVKAQAALSERFPEFRFGQMVAGLAGSGRDFTNEALYDIEDHKWLAAARELLAQRPAPTDEGATPSSSDGSRAPIAPINDQSVTNFS